MTQRRQVISNHKNNIIVESDSAAEEDDEENGPHNLGINFNDLDPSELRELKASKIYQTCASNNFDGTSTVKKWFGRFEELERHDVVDFLGEHERNYVK